MQLFNKKLGYYTCDGIDFYSKIQACLHSVKVNKPVKWVFNDDVFSAIDWSAEPPETLDQLYDQRARQLREDYDYIILSYSGGADSHNIYESFRRQGLKIDEFLVNTMTKASERYVVVDPHNMNAYDAPEAEHRLQLIPRLKEIERDMPTAKITIHDLSDHLFDMLGNTDESWVLNMKEGLNPIGITRFNYLYFKDVKLNFDKGKKIALITGVEKPRTYIKNDSFYFRFVDRSANINTIAHYLDEYENSTVEYFYWAPESAKILVKQAHIIKKWLEAFPNNQTDWLEINFNPHTTRLIHERVLRNLLYTTWNPTWYQADKALSDWYSEFDRWFIDHYRTSAAWKNWHAGVDYVKNNLAPFLKKNKAGNFDGFKNVVHDYYVGKIKTVNNTWLE